MDTRVFDHRGGYGLVSRALHWGIALLMAWQAASALLHYFADDTPVSDVFFASHMTIGVLLLVLTALRGVWGLVNATRRPPHAHRLDRLAALGHLAIYAGMLVVPGVALVRAYGGGRGFSVFGVQLFPAFEPKIDWMVGLGSALHGLLGWILLLLIAGHIAMALLHQYVWKDGRLTRMTVGEA